MDSRWEAYIGSVVPAQVPESVRPIGDRVLFGVGLIADRERRLQARLNVAQAELRAFNYPLNDFLDCNGQMTLFRRSLLERYRNGGTCGGVPSVAHSRAAGGQAETWSSAGPSSENATSIRAAPGSSSRQFRCPRPLISVWVRIDHPARRKPTFSSGRLVYGSTDWFSGHFGAADHSVGCCFSGSATVAEGFLASSEAMPPPSSVSQPARAVDAIL